MISTLPELLRSHRRQTGSRLVFHDRTCSYGELDDAAQNIAGALADAGVGEGDRVAIWLDTGFAWLATFFACARLGAITVAINSRFRSVELSDIVDRSGATALVMAGDDRWAMETLAECETLGKLRLVVTAWGTPAAVPDKVKALDFRSFDAMLDHAPRTRDDSDPDKGCVIFTTSGTTSKPKFVLHRQINLIRHGFQVAEFGGITARSIVFQLPPFCGTFGMSTAFSALSPGAGLVALRAFEASQAAAMIHKHGVTHTMATNDGLHHLIAADETGALLDSLGYVGLAATNPSLGGLYALADSRAITIASMYGSSELQAIVALQKRDASLEDRSLQGGFLVSKAATVRCCNPETGEVLAHGEQGELEFLCPDSAMMGYYGNEEATAKATRPDGYYRSGDFGYTMPDGRFVFLGRMGDSLRLGGFLVDPREIETAIEHLDGVSQAQVVAIDTERGARPVAFVILTGGGAIDEESMKAELGRRIARFKVPVRIHVVDDFPKTVSANATKIQKGKLRDMARQLAAAG